MPRKSYPSSRAISGMYFPSSASSENCIPFQASILGRTFAERLNRKLHPTLSSKSGTHFPLTVQRETASHSEPRFRDALSGTTLNGKVCPTLEAGLRDVVSRWLSLGKCVPFLGLIVGCGFPLSCLWESMSHSRLDSGTHFPKACPSGKPVPLWTHPGTEPSTYQAFHQ